MIVWYRNFATFWTNPASVYRSGTWKVKTSLSIVIECPHHLCIWFHISGSLNPELFANGWCAIRKVCVRCVHGRLAVFSFRPDPHTQLSRSLFQNAPPAPKPADDACVDWSMSVSSLLFSNLFFFSNPLLSTHRGTGVSRKKETKKESLSIRLYDRN